MHKLLESVQIKPSQEAYFLPCLQFRNPSKYHKYQINLNPEKKSLDKDNSTAQI